MLRDTVSGKTFLDITNIVAFQEHESLSALPKNTSSVPKSKRRPIPCDQSRTTDTPIVDAKKEPTVFSKDEVNQRINPEDVKTVSRTVEIWCELRLLMSSDQTIPMLSGWLTGLRNLNAEIPIRKTQETFLPSITSSITEYATISGADPDYSNLCASISQILQKLHFSIETLFSILLQLKYFITLYCLYHH